MSSHRLNDDPIIAFAQPGAFHAHEFFGNTGTTAASTYESLRAQPPRYPGHTGTTCTRPGDTAAYWVPALLRGQATDGSLIRPSDAHIYYTGGGKKLSSIRAFPPGLKIVAGDAQATKPQKNGVARWYCEKKTYEQSGDLPYCPHRHAVLRVRFPDCWDGRRIDSPSHRAHMAYAQRGRGDRLKTCPKSHPVPVPLLILNARFGAPDLPKMRLASGSLHSGHADFFNAWDQDELERLVRSCIRAGKRCGRGAPLGTGTAHDEGASRVASDSGSEPARRVPLCHLASADRSAAAGGGGNSVR